MSDRQRHALLSTTRPLTGDEEKALRDTLEGGLRTMTLSSYTISEVDTLLSIHISYGPRGRSIQRILGWIQKKTKKTLALYTLIEDAEDETEEEEKRRIQREMAEEEEKTKEEERKKNLPNIIPILILDGKTLRAKNMHLRIPLGVNPHNGKLHASTGYSVIYDRESIDWYKEHFFGGVVLFLKREKVEMLKNMPTTPRLGRYLQALAREKDFKKNLR